MSQVEHSSIMIGIPNLECVVLPPGMSKVAIPLEATVKTISPFDHSAADIALQMNVLLVPPFP